MSRKSKSAPFPGQQEFVRQQNWPDRHYWAPFLMCNRDRSSNECSFKQTPGNGQSRGVAAAGRQSQTSWNRLSPLPGPLPSSTIGNASAAAASRGLQPPGPWINDSLMVKVSVCVCVCACMCTVCAFDR